MSINLLYHYRTEVLLAETIKTSSVFLDAVLCSLVEVHWHHMPEIFSFNQSLGPKVYSGISTHDNEQFNLLTPNDDYSGCTAPLTSKRCILYIYSKNIGTGYFKHGMSVWFARGLKPRSLVFSLIYSPFFPLQNAFCFINLTYLVPVLFTFYIQGVLKLKKIIPVPKG